MSDVREKQRFTVWFPMKVQAENEEAVAVSRNVSEKGILMASARNLEVGKPITVTFRLSAAEGGERTVVGRIVRCEPNSEDPDGLWPYRVAVEFEEKIEDLETTLQKLSDKLPF